MVNKRTGKKDKKNEFGTNQLHNCSKNESHGNWKVKLKKKKKNYHKKQENLQVSQIFHD